MKERSRFIKVRVSESEYMQLRQRADAAGVTMSEHVREAVTTVHQAVDVVTELAALRQQMRQAAISSSGTQSNCAGTENHEMLLLLRELAAARDAQILARVRAQLASRVVGQEQRGGTA